MALHDGTIKHSTDGGGTFPVVVEDNMAGDINPAVGTIIATFPLPGGGSVLFTINSNRTLGFDFARISEVDLAFAGGAIDFGAADPDDCRPMQRAFVRASPPFANRAAVPGIGH